MKPKCFYSENFTLFIVKFKKLGFSTPLTLHQTCKILFARLTFKELTVSKGGYEWLEEIASHQSNN